MLTCLHLIFNVETFPTSKTSTGLFFLRSNSLEYYYNRDSII